MKKIFFLLIILTLVGCATQIENKNVVLQKGMTKNEVWSKFHNDWNDLTFVYQQGGDDIFCCGAGNEYFLDTKQEILWGRNQKYFYVFDNVTITTTFGRGAVNPIHYEGRRGDGNFQSVHTSIDEARKQLKIPYAELKKNAEQRQLTEQKKSQEQKKIVEQKKLDNEFGRFIDQCEYIGFKRNTEKMGDCVLKISQAEKKMVDIQVSNSGGDSVANLILLQESLKLLQPPANPRRNVQCTYNTVGGILGVNCF
jgi:hypothetical protein